MKKQITVRSTWLSIFHVPSNCASIDGLLCEAGRNTRQSSMPHYDCASLDVRSSEAGGSARLTSIPASGATFDDPRNDLGCNTY
jgi:hypothetical protein